VEALRPRDSRLTPRLALVAAALLVAFAMLFVPASPAHAHDELLGSDPAANATIDALPGQLTLTFSAEIADDEGASVVQVTDAAGTALAVGTPTVRDNLVTQALSGEASGAIKVLWKVVSSDGHPISGEFSFTVTGAPTPTATATETTAPTPSATAEPSETATPTPTVTSEPAASDGSSALPWVIAGLLALALIGAVVYLLVSRSRREKALADGAQGTAGGPSQPGSPPSADH
jgi:methionine-rich copper-binding protein CopC